MTHRFPAAWLRPAMASLVAAHAGIPEWHVHPGALVQTGAVLGWLAVADHCALEPLRAPADGVVRFLLDPALGTVPAGTALALLDDDPAPLLEAQARAAQAELTYLEQRLGGATPHTPLAQALLRHERASLETRAQALRALLTPHAERH